METGPQPKLSSDRLEKPGIEPATSGLQGEWFIHYTMVASIIYYKYFDQEYVYESLCQQLKLLIKAQELVTNP